MKADETMLHNGVRRVVLVSYISLYPQEMVRAGECFIYARHGLVVGSHRACSCSPKISRNFRVPEPRADKHGRCKDA
jgi:hypothetical protein